MEGRTRERGGSVFQTWGSLTPPSVRMLVLTNQESSSGILHSVSRNFYYDTHRVFSSREVRAVEEGVTPSPFKVTGKSGFCTQEELIKCFVSKWKVSWGKKNLSAHKVTSGTGYSVQGFLP